MSNIAIAILEKLPFLKGITKIISHFDSSKNTFNIYSCILLSQMQRCATYDSRAGITKQN